MSSSPQRPSGPKLLTIFAVILFLGSSGVFGTVTKTITNTATVEVTNPALVNVVVWIVSNDPAKVEHYTQAVSHLRNLASVSSTVLIPPVTEIPTLSPGGAIALILFLAGFAWFLSRRRSASP